MSNYEYRVELVDLPVTVPSLVSYDDDGFPTILVNARLSRIEQKHAVNHELDHIEHEDIYSELDTATIEYRASRVG